MKLSKYILDLLYRYELVIIPDLGGFLVKPVSAQIDEKTHVFSPPAKRLGFNAQLKENDGLLANHIAAVDKMPYETAVNFIKFEVKELLEKLKEQDVNLEGIGAFSLNSEGNLLFNPDSNANFLTESFGLSNITSSVIHRVKREENELNLVFDTITEEISAKEIALSNEVSRSGGARFMKYAAGLILLLGLGYLLLMNFGDKSGETIASSDANNSQVKELQEAKFEIPGNLAKINLRVEKLEGSEEETNEIITENTNDEVSNNETNTTSEETATEDSTEESSETSTPVVTSDETSENTTDNTVKPLNDTPTSNEVSLSSETGKYHIIAGAFKSPQNADKKVLQLKAKGFDSHIVGINKWELTQVAFASYSTKEEAKQALEEIKRSEAKDAWILVK